MSICRRTIILSLFLFELIFAQYWPEKDAFTLTEEAKDGNVSLTVTNNVNYVISIPENFPLNQSLVNLNYNDSIGKIFGK